MSLRQRMYPTAGQEPSMVMHAQHARFIYNLGLEQRSMWTEAKRYSVHKINFATQSRQLTELRKDLDWLRAGSTVVRQGALRDLDAAFKNFFAGTAKCPTFKSASKGRDGFVIRDLALRRVNRRWAQILVPKTGWVKFRLTYPWSAALAGSSARATKRNGIWHVSITTPPRPRMVAGTGRSVGIDVGIANTMATSDGEKSSIPALAPGQRQRYLALQRKLSRQVKGSASRARTLAAMARLRARTENLRTDWIEQTTTRLARTYDLAAMENLRIANMVKRPEPQPDPEAPGAYLPNGAAAKAGLNRRIHESSWGKFTLRLGQKMETVGVNPAGTSQECRKCQHTSPENRKSQAVFRCVRCGHGEHADTHAAKNILGRATSHKPTWGLPGDRARQPRTAGRANQTWKHCASSNPGIPFRKGGEDVKYEKTGISENFGR